MGSRTLNLSMAYLACLLATACAVQPLPSASQSEAPVAMQSVCEGDKYRQFDFWLGQWDVFTSDGKRVGRNSIEARHNGCVLHESYQTIGHFSGESLNIFDASRGVWHQTWTDSSGTLLRLEGGLQGASMVLEGQTRNPEGERVSNRITWTPNADGTVRQHWEVRTTATDWTDAFDGLYRPVSSW